MRSDIDAQTNAIGPSVDLLSGFAFSSSGFHETEGLPLIRIRDLGNVSTEVHFRGRYDDQFLVRNGDVLVGMDGDFIAVRWSGGLALLNQRVCKVSAKAGGALDDGYLYHILQPHLDEIHRRTPQTTVRHLSAKSILDIRPFSPAVPEQRRIAEILDTLDEAIRKTEQVIAKLQQMKQGLIHDLLTRGIDDNGELRDPERHPEHFKDSPLGRIPREWEVRRVDALLADVDPAMRSGPFGSALLKNELVSSGVPLLGIDNVQVERFVSEYTRFVTAQKAVELDRYRVRPRDVMITIMGTVGRCALVPDDIETALSSKHVWTLSFDQNGYSPYLVCLQFNHASWVLRHFGRDVQGGIMSAIRSETLRTALLPVPPRQEQAVIETILRDLDRRALGEQHDADKLRTLKHGLMDDLLTGRVRVPVSAEAAA